MKHRVNPWTIVLILAIMLTVYLYVCNGPILLFIGTKIMAVALTCYDVLLADALLRDGELRILSNIFNNVQE